MTVDASKVVITTTTIDPLTGWTVVIRDGVEIDRYPPPPEQPSEFTATRDAARILAASLVADLDAQEGLARLAPLYAPWYIDQAVDKGDMRTYQGAVVECIQEHTTQEDWPPTSTPNLWKVYRAPGADWVQPAGGHDAYPLDAIVTHNDSTWKSTVAANVWEPGVSGWDVVPSTSSGTLHTPY